VQPRLTGRARAPKYFNVPGCLPFRCAAPFYRFRYYPTNICGALHLIAHAHREEFGSFDKYIWQFVNHKTIVNKWERMEDVPVSTPESDAMSKDLKNRGFKFVGTTICYAFMQAAGMVNDHIVSCFRYDEVNP
jgi:hypothetical protein